MSSLSKKSLAEKAWHLQKRLKNAPLIKINTQVLDAFKVLGRESWARVDFFIKDEQIILLEINTIPGMTDHSLVPKAAKKHGLSYYQLVLEIIGIDG